MRFKDQARREEQRALLRNQQVNNQYEEKCGLWSSTTKLTSQRTDQQQQHQHLQRPSRWPLSICPSPVLTSAYPQSPTGASSGDDAESLSDLEYNESSPLLGQDEVSSDREEEEDSSDDCNRNSEEEDSMFSDSSCDMSESKTGVTGSTLPPTPLSLDNSIVNGNNNNNRNLTTTTTRPSSASGALDRGERVFRDTVQPLLQPVHVRPSAPMKIMVPPLPVPPPPQLDSPMSEGSEELDLNMIPEPDLNDVSLGKGGLHSLLPAEEINILSGDDEEEEAKILNVLLCGEGNRREVKELEEPVDRADAVPEVAPPVQSSAPNFGDFDVYTIETAMPTIDWAAMEAHLAKSAKENDWMRRRRNDREEIRRKLAMDSDSEEYYCGERVPNGKKPSLTTRLQSGMNLQICFMNETASDLDSQSSDHDYENGNSRIPPSYGPVPATPPVEPVPSAKESLSDQRISALLDASLILDTSLQHHSSRQHTNRINKTSPLTNNNPTLNGDDKCQRPSFFFNRQRSWRLRSPKDKKDVQQNEQQVQQETPFNPREDFVTRHARLQAEARHALAQAKEMARMQMEVERQRKKKSPIADIVGIPFADGWHRLNRHVLSDMNVAQLQVIVNDLHSQIESLNEDLVRLLLERDDLHMEQDSMLVDIEDLTRYLGAKDDSVRSQPLPSQL